MTKKTKIIGELIEYSNVNSDGTFKDDIGAIATTQQVRNGSNFVTLISDRTKDGKVTVLYLETDRADKIRTLLSNLVS